MRRTLALLFAVTMLAACAQKRQPTKPKPVITAQEVKLCIDTAFQTRDRDELCDNDSATSCCTWRYVRNQEPWPLELPAINQVLEKGRGFAQPLPGSTPVTIPPEGAIFQR